MKTHKVYLDEIRFSTFVAEEKLKQEGLNFVELFFGRLKEMLIKEQIVYRYKATSERKCQRTSMTSFGAFTHVTLMVMSSQWTRFAGELTSDRWGDRLFASQL